MRQNLRHTMPLASDSHSRPKSGSPAASHSRPSPFRFTPCRDRHLERHCSTLPYSEMSNAIGASTTIATPHTLRISTWDLVAGPESVLPGIGIARPRPIRASGAAREAMPKTTAITQITRSAGFTIPTSPLRKEAARAVVVRVDLGSGFVGLSLDGTERVGEVEVRFPACGHGVEGAPGFPVEPHVRATGALGGETEGSVVEEGVAVAQAVARPRAQEGPPGCRPGGCTGRGLPRGCHRAAGRVGRLRSGRFRPDRLPPDRQPRRLRREGLAGDPVNRIDPIGPLPMGDVVGAAAGTVTGVALDGVAGPVLGGAAGGCAGGAATAAVDGEGAGGVGKSCLDRGREYGTPVPPGWEVR